MKLKPKSQESIALVPPGNGLGVGVKNAQMEHNKDDAIRSLEIAKRALADGQIEKAIKFAEKSDRLFPNFEARKLVNTARSGGGTASAQGSANRTSASNSATQIVMHATWCVDLAR
eukprot:1195904-Prorocentrum_minimum.AAC.4